MPATGHETVGSVPPPADPAAPGRAQVNRLNTLTGLRFPAAFVVFLYHASLLAFLGVPWLSSTSAVTTYYDAVAHAGALGVTFFFVLSGFVLTWSARDTDTAPRFWRRRFVKIVPNYVLVWGLAMLVFAAPVTDMTIGVLNLLLVQVWYPDFAVNFGVNPAGWSLGVEAVFYLSFPVLFHWIKKIPAHRLNFWVAAAAAGIVATPLLSELLVPAGTAMMATEPDTSVNQYFFAYILPLPRVLDFALGILVARSVMAGRWRNIGMVWSGVLLAASYVVGYFTPPIYSTRAVCVIPAALLTGIRSDLPGQVTAQVTDDVYDSPTGKFRLIPQGARLVGQYDAQAHRELRGVASTLTGSGWQPSGPDGSPATNPTSPTRESEPAGSAGVGLQR